MDSCYQYPKCELANGNERECSLTYPLNSNNDNPDPLYKCDYNNGICSNVKKKLL